MIYLGADHGGFELKETVKSWLSDHGYTFEDLGNTVFDKEDDYPAYAFAVADRVRTEEAPGNQYPHPWGDRPKGILACRSAAGVIIAANKVKGVRAVAVTNEEMTQHAREHNDANVIALSGDWLTDAEALKIVETFLATEFSGEKRHARRLSQIAAFESLPETKKNSCIPFHPE